MKIYEFPEIPVEEETQGVRYRLADADIPRRFRVVTTENQGSDTLRVEIEYRAATGEGRRSVKSGRVAAEVGRFSNRLFALSISAPSGIWERSAAEQIAVALTIIADLIIVFNTLKGTAAGGARLNYRAAQAGLQVEDVALQTKKPPPWLIEALSGSERRGAVRR